MKLKGMCKNQDKNQGKDPNDLHVVAICRAICKLGDKIWWACTQVYYNNVLAASQVPKNCLP